MDKAVSNAGPLIHLAEIGEFELLKIFSKICIPEMVYEEVCIEGMPGEREVRSAENIEVLSVSKEEIEKVSNKVDLLIDLKRAKRASGDLYSISKLFVTKAIIEEAIKELEMF